MSRLPPLGPTAVIRLWREGGMAYLPALMRPAAIALEDCSEAERQAICRVLEVSAQQADAEQAGRGDQRYFRIEVQLARDDDSVVDLKVPEARAPDGLVKLWKERQG